MNHATSSFCLSQSKQASSGSTATAFFQQASAKAVSTSISASLGSTQPEASPAAIRASPDERAPTSALASRAHSSKRVGFLAHRAARWLKALRSINGIDLKYSRNVEVEKSYRIGQHFDDLPEARFELIAMRYRSPVMSNRYDQLPIKLRIEGS